MIYSSKRKLMLSGWLMKHNPESYGSSLKHQKFLFFYEAVSKTNGKEYEFTHLCGYKNGPVFNKVLGDYTHERALFDEQAEETYEKRQDKVDNSIAELCSFVTAILNESDLSLFTHKFNIWKSREAEIQDRTKNIYLEDEDFNEADKDMIRSLQSMYPSDFIRNSAVISISGKNFLFSRDDVKKLKVSDYDTLCELSDNEELINPVYVNIGPKGVLEVD